MFQGFEPAVVDFMWGIRFNNSREWFEPRKAEYKEIFEAPMKELCRDLYTGFTDKHPDLGMVSRVSRIYRDARRLFGRGPYKDRDPKPVEKLARAVNKQDTFQLRGETFKRPREAPSKLLEPWYNLKGGFSLSCARPHDDLLWSPDLPGHILEEWEKLLPLFRYLTTLDGDPDPREN